MSDATTSAPFVKPEGFSDGKPVPLRAKKIAADLLTGTSAELPFDWATEKNQDNKAADDQRRVVTLPLDQPLADGVTNQDIMRAISHIVTSNAINYSPQNMRDNKVITPYALRETPESTPPEFRIDLSAEYADHLASKLLSKQVG